LMDEHLEDQTYGVHKQMPLAPFDSLPAIVTADPPF
jgi:hypothetical protein